MAGVQWIKGQGMNLRADEAVLHRVGCLDMIPLYRYKSIKKFSNAAALTAGSHPWP